MWSSAYDLQRHLVAIIEDRLRCLEEKRAPLRVEQEENAACGRSLEAIVQECCPAVELERYLLFVGDFERVVSLLLCLSARLARVENALTTVDQHTDAEEKVSSHPTIACYPSLNVNRSKAEKCKT